MQRGIHVKKKLCYIKNTYSMQMSHSTSLNKSHTKLLGKDDALLWILKEKKFDCFTDFNVDFSC